MTAAFEQKLVKVDRSGARALGNLIDVYANPRDGHDVSDLMYRI